MDQVTVTKVVEGPSSLVIRVNLLSDGTGELSNQVILSPADLNPVRPNDIPAFRLMQVWYQMASFDLTLQVNSITPTPLWTLAKNSDSHTDFRSFGGLIDTAVYTNPTAVDDGKLMISTSGFATAGSFGTLVLSLVKTNQASA